MTKTRPPKTPPQYDARWQFKLYPEITMADVEIELDALVEWIQPTLDAAKRQLKVSSELALVTVTPASRRNALLHGMWALAHATSARKAVLEGDAAAAAYWAFKAGVLGEAFRKGLAEYRRWSQGGVERAKNISADPDRDEQLSLINEEAKQIRRDDPSLSKKEIAKRIKLLQRPLLKGRSADWIRRSI